MWTMRACLVLFALFVGVHSAAASSISIGTLAYDSFDSPFTTVFNLSNYTGPFALPPDAPAIDSVTLTDAVLDIYDDGGLYKSVILGDLAPGPLLDVITGMAPADLQSLASDLFVRARLSASVAFTPILLADGSTFTPNLSSVLLDLLPSSGPYLAPGDVGVIQISGDVTPASVPEPISLLLMGVGLAAIARRVRRHQTATR
jgi:hypothetical protein